MVELIDVSVRCNLEKTATRSDSHVVTGSVPGQQSVDVWKLDDAATAECCRSSVHFPIAVDY